MNFVKCFGIILKLMDKCKDRQKIGDILYDHGGKPGTHYPDLETGSGYLVSAKNFDLPDQV